MYQAELHLQQDKECVLSRLARETHEPLQLDIQELHDNRVTFILDVSPDPERWTEELRAEPSVHHVDTLDDEYLAVTKTSCCAYSAIHQNQAVIRRHPNYIREHSRVYNVLVFSREDLQSVVADLQSVGSVSLANLTQFGGRSTFLTERQTEVLRTAVNRGYFEWPRDVSSEELADDLGITRATFLEHLRKAQEKVFMELFAEDQPQSMSVPPGETACSHAAHE
ncbi:helix-turn-helix domain-containing protein [Natronococcus sp. A-GB7]|uniref:helix-turn-helix domain-containing protein n=1 Tax=Natronococcus sp. A-GB7 TaxID=3037649 RepID=UPI00241C5EC3|nr:helix-turn-helix domain-containing protein [Natronococcus sp. A-GB7]MDG5820214.1 helix-turn-helix domain-containing protein [Natronococcus sp. A-GB7]